MSDINVNSVSIMRGGQLPHEPYYYEYLERMLQQYQARLERLEEQLADHESRITALEP